LNPFSIDYVLFLHLNNAYYYIYCITQLNKLYFIVRGSNIIFFEYPTFFMVLVATQTFVDSQVVRRLCLFDVVGPRLAYLKLPIIFVGIFQFLLLITHKGDQIFC
jgi:hypothetical protein